MKNRFSFIKIFIMTIFILSFPTFSIGQDNETNEINRTNLYNNSGISIYEGEFCEEYILENLNIDTEILRVPEVCNGKPYYVMRSSGFGRVTLANGSIYIRSGACFQCSGCNLVMVTEGDPLKGYRIGKYALASTNYPIEPGGANIDIPEKYGVWNSSTMTGYKFVFGK